MIKRLIFGSFLLIPSVLLGEITGIVTPPHAPNQSVQFNNNGTFGGSGDFTYSPSTKKLSVSSITASLDISARKYFGDGSALTGISAGGGGASSLAIGTGSAQAVNIVSSPTAIITFSSQTFKIQKITPGATAFITIDFSTWDATYVKSIDWNIAKSTQAGGGTNSSISIGTGSPQAMNVTSSGTVLSMNFDSSTFKSQLNGTTTNFISIDFSTWGANFVRVQDWNIAKATVTVGGGGSDGFGNPVSTRPITALSGVDTSSLTVVGTTTITGLIQVSSGALLGGATIQGTLRVENNVSLSSGFVYVLMSSAAGQGGFIAGGSTFTNLTIFNLNDSAGNSILKMNASAGGISMQVGKVLLFDNGTEANPGLGNTTVNGSGMSFGAAGAFTAINHSGKHRIKATSLGTSMYAKNAYASVDIGTISIGNPMLIVHSSPGVEGVGYPQLVIWPTSTTAGNIVYFSSWVVIQSTSFVVSGIDYLVHNATVDAAIASLTGGGITQDQANVVTVSTWNAIIQKISTQTLVYNGGININALAAGSNITLSQSGSTVTIASSGGSGAPGSFQNPSTGTLSMGIIGGSGFGIANSTGIELGNNLQLTTWMSTASRPIWIPVPFSGVAGVRISSDQAVVTATTAVSGLNPYLTPSFSMSSTDTLRYRYHVPMNIDASSTVLISFTVSPATAAPNTNVQMLFNSSGTVDGIVPNSVSVSTGVDFCAMPAGQQVKTCSVEVPVGGGTGGLNWLPDMEVWIDAKRAHDTSKLAGTDANVRLFFPGMTLYVPIKH